MASLETPLPATPGLLRRASAIGLDGLVNIALPFAVFSLTRAQLGDVHAMMAASAPPLAWSIVEFIRRRRIDALSMLALTGIVLSLIAFAGGGGIKALQLRDGLVTGLIGLVFLTSAALGRPLIYYLCRATMMRTAPARAARLAAMRNDDGVRRAMLTMTLAWGVGLTGECAAAAALTWVLPLQQYLIAGPVLGYGVIAALTGWTIWFGRRRVAARLR
ncbi:MAG TPA: VC0807 family protein [Caulobacteraceae bacterium]|nr:VC0807 family protein [Caulobacteraceae bacterium]